MKPTLTRERAFWDAGMSRIAGVDEVGVAPTCGAVVAAAVIMPPNGRRIPGIRDSKTLSALQRERLVPVIRRRAVAIGVGAASVREIDQLNIYHATHLAMRRAIARIGDRDHVLVDGLRITGFEAEVGPYTAIVERGLTPFHRRSFHALDVLLGGEQQTFDLEIEIDPEELELEELSALAG